MIDREDMLELTRRMTPARSSVDRIAGGYLDDDGEVDGTFNIHFLKLSGSEKAKNLALCKAVVFAKTNEELREYNIPDRLRGPQSIWMVLDAMRACGLKNDAMMEIFYEVFGEAMLRCDPPIGPCGVFMFHGCYDVPVKGKDKEWMEGSEEIYDYLVCAVCPVDEDYEPSAPVCGFLYPAFRNHCTDTGYVNVFENAGAPRPNLLRDILYLER